MKTCPSSTPQTKLVWFLLDLHDSKIADYTFSETKPPQMVPSAGYIGEKKQGLAPWFSGPKSTTLDMKTFSHQLQLLFRPRVSRRSLARAILAHHPLSCHDTLTCTPNGSSCNMLQQDLVVSYLYPQHVKSAERWIWMSGSPFII